MGAGNFECPLLRQDAFWRAFSNKRPYDLAVIRIHPISLPGGGITSRVISDGCTDAFNKGHVLPGQDFVAALGIITGTRRGRWLFIPVIFWMEAGSAMGSHLNLAVIGIGPMIIGV
jgi:hypothetical protein